MQNVPQTQVMTTERAEIRETYGPSNPALKSLLSDLALGDAQKQSLWATEIRQIEKESEEHQAEKSDEQSLRDLEDVRLLLQGNSHRLS